MILPGLRFLYILASHQFFSCGYVALELKLQVFTEVTARGELMLQEQFQDCPAGLDFLRSADIKKTRTVAGQFYGIDYPLTGYWGRTWFLFSSLAKAN